jgi:serine/threonine protein kinase
MSCFIPETTSKRALPI